MTRILLDNIVRLGELELERIIHGITCLSDQVLVQGSAVLPPSSAHGGCVDTAEKALHLVEMGALVPWTYPGAQGGNDHSLARRAGPKRTVELSRERYLGIRREIDHGGLRRVDAHSLAQHLGRAQGTDEMHEIEGTSELVQVRNVLWKTAIAEQLGATRIIAGHGVADNWKHLNDTLSSDGQREIILRTLLDEEGIPSLVHLSSVDIESLRYMNHDFRRALDEELAILESHTIDAQELQLVANSLHRRYVSGLEKIGRDLNSWSLAKETKRNLRSLVLSLLMPCFGALPFVEDLRKLGFLRDSDVQFALFIVDLKERAIAGRDNE